MLYALTFSALVSAVLAYPAGGTQSAWGQCGGQGWNGATSCVSGYYCYAQNPYYSQCIPGTASSSTTKTTTTTTKSTTKSTTTTSKTTTKATTTAVSSTTAVGSTTVVGTTTSAPSGPTTTAPAGSPVTYGTGNPFIGYQQYANSFYQSEVSTLAIPSLPSSLQAAAASAAAVPNFFWMDTLSKVPVFDALLDDVRSKNAAGASPPLQALGVVYDLPDRDCAAEASNGEYSIANDGVAHYKNYIDTIKASVVAHSDVPIIFVVEPDSVANLVTNTQQYPKCGNAQSAYLECINYALENLNLPNVAMYLDAGHGGWLGWPANIVPAAQLYASIYKNASSPASLHGLATNVANYNAWDISSAPSYTTPNPDYDEKIYIHDFAPRLANNGWSGVKFIVDQGRSGVQPTKQIAQGDWCNVIGTGFGIRPTNSDTGDSLLDAFVWVKPGGESDGTSDSSANRYDGHCGLQDALKPAPQAGTWFQAYFQQLLVNANPSFT